METRLKPCRVCAHLEGGVIDRALLEHGQSPRNIIRRYAGLSRRDVARHRDVCLKARPKGQPGSDKEAA
jgi:hypothetical protein